MESLSEPTEPAALIAAGLESWFFEEARTSGNSRNNYLDDLERAHTNFRSTVDDPTNTSANKSFGHLSRPTGIWWQGFASDLSDDFLTARQIFASQMLASGAYREQIQLQSTSQEDYFQRKLTGIPMGVDVLDVVTQRLVTRLSSPPHAIDLSKASMALDELYDTASEAVLLGVEKTELLASEGRHYIGHEDSPLVDKLKEAQMAWIGLAVDHIIFATQQRDGELAKVPFLHPISISDQPEDPLLYPFAA